MELVATTVPPATPLSYIMVSEKNNHKNKKQMSFSKEANLKYLNTSIQFQRNSNWEQENEIRRCKNMFLVCKSWKLSDMFAFCCETLF